MAAGCSVGAADSGPPHASAYPLPSIHLVLLMGLPASGKTTVARTLQRQQQQQHRRGDIDVVVHHICIDDLYNSCIAETAADSAAFPSSSFVTASVPAPFSPAVWHRSRSLALDKTRQLLTELLTSPADSLSASSSPLQLLLVDDVLHLRSMRRAYHRLCRQLQLPFTQLMLDTPLSVCIERHEQRVAAASASCSPSASHSSLTAATIASLHSAFQRPSASELPYTVILASAPSPALQRGQLLSLIRSASVLPPPAAEDATRDAAAEQQQMQSALHLLDIAMRRRIGERMQASRAAAAEGERVALSLNAVRRAVLREARQPGSLVNELLKPGWAKEEDEQSPGRDGQLAGDNRSSRALEYFTQLLDSL